MGFFHNTLISWVHEASHGNIIRSKKINQIFADIFLCGPAGISLSQYQWHHLSHHKFLGDPKLEIELYAWTPIKGWHLPLEIIKHLTGMYALSIIFRKRRFLNSNNVKKYPRMSITAGLSFLIFNISLFIIFLATNAWYLYFIIWVAPLFTTALLISNLRTLVEHQMDNLPKVNSIEIEMPPLTRIFKCSTIQRILIAPIGFYYHNEHHLYPSVPHYNLPQLRAKFEELGIYKNATPKSYLKTLWLLCMNQKII
jgi:fatty acid desaturase